MFEGTRLKPKQEHIDKVLGYLANRDLTSPYVIKNHTGLSLTAVKCVLNKLYKEDRLIVVTQDKTPRRLVKLKDV